MGSRWGFQSEELANGRGIRMTLNSNGLALCYGEVIERWQDSEDFRSFFVTLLADSPFSAFRWETPPMTTAIAQQPFECVLLNSPDLIREADPEPFAEHFLRHLSSPPSSHSSSDSSDAEGAIVFPNLGGDAILIVPCPHGPSAAYAHLGAFIRLASEVQKHALWQQVGKCMEKRLSENPVWLSTAGGGVAWLHVRLDDRPKYYGHIPYRTNP